MTLGMWLYVLLIMILGVGVGLIIYSKENKITIKQAIKIKLIVLKLQFSKCDTHFK